ncbi:sigma-w pathway protein ysdB [Sediminibacillus massiliensis]|uniref:sigma-w pathway protein ysdB n=1 Tax=Sediminibacillus massiliensis TaxID=1926277 RepID=UPI0009885E2C|nr:sigma-w pathway protein ysdB [Sediminibacillus massiliensis]
MIVILFRLLILTAIIFILYTVYKYIINPNRKLEVAKDKKDFYFLDEPDNTKKNFLMTYKGYIFEGEKYLGTTENSFDVVNISVYAKHPAQLKGLERNDLHFMEKEILIRYPYAKVEWKHPLNKLLVLK